MRRPSAPSRPGRARRSARPGRSTPRRHRRTPGSGGPGQAPGRTRPAGRRPGPAPGRDLVPARPPILSTRPAPGSRDCRRHMATITAGPAKAAKTIAGTAQRMPTVVLRRVTISCTAVAPSAATSPIDSPSQNPNRYNGAGSRSAAARCWPDGCVQPRCQAQCPVRAGRSASTASSAIPGSSWRARASASNSRDRRIALRREYTISASTTMRQIRICGSPSTRLTISTTARGSSAATTKARQIARVRYVWSISRFLMWESSCKTTASNSAGFFTAAIAAPPVTATRRRPGRPNANADSRALSGWSSQTTGPVPAR